MGESKPQMTRRLASKLTDVKQIDSVEQHNGSVGSIDFLIAEGEALSSNRVARLLPDGWTVRMVATQDPWTSVYVEPSE